MLLVCCLVLAFMFIGNFEAAAQCPMCRMSAETNLQNGGSMGKGLNKGILYMLSLPYLLVGTLGYIWWRNRRKFTSEIIEESFSNN
ncbi:MAG: hypothetical protein HKO66_06155 [Saprospiraceae bacterium]|nr:hypothetical protein [Saprospiraceae bacterium]